jgi:pimeloyl-ACP methyl ester carboxylesterase
MIETGRERSLTVSEIDVGGVPLSVFQGGTGTPLLFLHGTDFNPENAIWDTLCREYRVIVPFHPGFGTSPIQSWMTSIDDFAYLYLSLMEQLGLEDVVLVGSSIGGWIAAEIATKNTTRTAKLILVGPVGIKVGPIDRLDIPDIFTMPKEALHRRLYFAPERFQRDPATRSDDELLIMARNRATLAMITWEPYMHNPKLKRRLSRVDCPTLVIRGEADGIVSDAYASAYTELIPGARMMSIPQAGHYPHIEQPERFNEALRSFCDGD